MQFFSQLIGIFNLSRFLVSSVQFLFRFTFPAQSVVFASNSAETYLLLDCIYSDVLGTRILMIYFVCFKSFMISFFHLLFIILFLEVHFFHFLLAFY